MGGTGNNCTLQLLLVIDCDLVEIGIAHPVRQQGDIEADDGGVQEERA